MKKLLLLGLSLCFLLPLAGWGQLSISGEISPSIMLRISDGSLINLPFRTAHIAADYALGDFEFKTTAALEARWKDQVYDRDMLQLREAYLIWYPRFGEIKLGKMIQAWGAADANNPTDNLSPYDYYYMFTSGTDRKLGTLAGAVKTYFGDWQAELSVQPEHVANRLPFDEPDFPITLPPEPDAALFEDVQNPLGVGLRIQRAFDIADLSLSYLKGHDQMFSVLALKGAAPNFIPHYGYRDTRVVGLDGVLFPGNWTLRGEAAYFDTHNPYTDPDDVVFDVDAQYLQYVIQVEYELASQIQVMAQLIGTNIISAEGRTIAVGPSGIPSVNLLNKDNFQIGMGTPFAMISDQVALLSSMVTLFDNALDLSGMLMINLKETGYMANLHGSYNLMEGVSLDAALAYFIGGDEQDNSFRQLEDFSNVTLGMSYTF